MLPIITPLTLMRQRQPFTNSDWLFEIKYDGFRSLAYIEDGTCRLVSRKGNRYQRFKELSTALSRLGSEAVADGEIVCLGDDGQPQVEDLKTK